MVGLQDRVQIGIEARSHRRLAIPVDTGKTLQQCQFRAQHRDLGLRQRGVGQPHAFGKILFEQLLALRLALLDACNQCTHGTLVTPGRRTVAEKRHGEKHYQQ